MTGNVSPIAYNPAMPPLSGLGMALARIRRSAGFDTQEALAKELGLTTSAINKVELEDSNPRASTLNRYLDACRADAHSLAYALDAVQGKPEPDAPRNREAELNELVLKMAARVEHLLATIEEIRNAPAE